MGHVDGKVAIVTGGASGIGAACAATLAREGAKIVITDLDDAPGREASENIGGAGGEAISLHQDVSVEEGWPAIIETAERRFGRPGPAAKKCVTLGYRNAWPGNQLRLPHRPAQSAHRRR